MCRFQIGWAGGVVALCIGCTPSFGEGISTARVAQIAGWLSDSHSLVGRPAADRSAWEQLASVPAFANLVSQAVQRVRKPMPELTEEIYLLFKTTGRRTKEYQRTRSERHGRIPLLTLAECLEYRGRFLSPLETTLRSICAEPTWVYNFHDRDLSNWKGQRTDIDLGSSALAGDLGLCLWLLGDRLSPECRALVSSRLRERILEPYRKSVEGRGPRQGWITAEHNWNAVCHAGVVAAALAISTDRVERAFFIAAAETNIQHFLRGFGPDGYCGEGMGYWNYGFGHFVLLAETLYQVTGGKLDLFEHPAAKEAALYPLRIHLHNDVYPALADCAVGTQPAAWIMAFLNRRYGWGAPQIPPRPADVADGDLLGVLVRAFPNSADRRPVPSTADRYEIRSYFRHGGVLVGRPLRGSECRMAVALKGGHNAEPHNHNDLGTFVVALGRETPILDPGAEVYTARTFSSKRYESRLLNSWGHPVPVVAGTLQKPGADARAVVLEETFEDARDVWTLDLRSAYSVPTLRHLTRTFVFERTGRGRLTVTDRFEFEKPETFGVALITCGPWAQRSVSELVITEHGESLEVTIRCDESPWRVSAGPIEEESSRGLRPIRIGIDLDRPVQKGTLQVAIVPRTP